MWDLRITLASLLAVGTAAADNVRRIVFHLDEAGPNRQSPVLNNVSSVNRHCQDKGQKGWACILP